jgi:NADH dehydrogenase
LILITGASGFVGRHLTRSLSQAGEPIKCLVRSRSAAANLEPLGVQCVVGDLTRPASLVAAVRDTRAVVHLAATMESHDAATFDAVNVKGTEHLVEQCRAAGVRRLIHVSSLDATLNVNAYGRSKRDAEETVRGSALAWTILRPGPIYGADDQVICPLANLIRRLPLVPVIGSGRQQLQLVFVDDVVAAIASALATDQSVGKIYHVAGRDAVTLEELMKLVEEHLHTKRRHVRLPVGMLKLGASIAECLMRSPPLTRDRLRGLCVDRVCEVEDTMRDLDWHPRDLQAGLVAALRAPPRHQ